MHSRMGIWLLTWLRVIANRRSVERQQQGHESHADDHHDQGEGQADAYEVGEAVVAGGRNH